MSEYNYEDLVQEGCFLHHKTRTATKTENVSNESCKKKRGAVCLEAVEIINGKRQDAYGKPEDSFSTIGKIMKVIEANFRAGDYSDSLYADLNLMALKFGRIIENPRDRDSWRDLIGYAALGCDMVCATDKEKD